MLCAWLYQSNYVISDDEVGCDYVEECTQQRFEPVDTVPSLLPQSQECDVDLKQSVLPRSEMIVHNDVVAAEIIKVETIAAEKPCDNHVASYEAIVGMKTVEINRSVPVQAQPNKAVALSGSTEQKTKSVKPMDLEEVCIQMPDNQQLVDRLKKAGFGGLASNKKFLDQLAGQMLSTEQIYDVASAELDKFKDKWVAKQRRGRLCNVLFQDYPEHVAYLKECEKIENNPKIYWKTAKLYAKNLKATMS